MTCQVGSLGWREFRQSLRPNLGPMAISSHQILSDGYNDFDFDCMLPVHFILMYLMIVNIRRVDFQQMSNPYLSFVYSSRPINTTIELILSTVPRPCPNNISSHQYFGFFFFFLLIAEGFHSLQYGPPEVGLDHKLSIWVTRQFYILFFPIYAYFSTCPFGLSKVTGINIELKTLCN